MSPALHFSGSVLLFPPKASASNDNTSDAKIQLVDTPVNTGVINSEKDEYLSKFLYVQIKDNISSSLAETDKELGFLVRTLITRFYVCKESTDIINMIQRMSAIYFKPENYDLNRDVEPELHKILLKHAKNLIGCSKALMWEDLSIVFYTTKNFKAPENDKNNIWTLKAQSAHFFYWSIKSIKNPEIFNADKLTEQEKFLARVIYSETSTICTPFEIRLVCKVIMNRIRK